MSYRKIKSLCLIAIFILLSSIVLAQDIPPLPGEILVDGLHSPRGLAFDADGNLYIADAGSGGETELTTLVNDTELTMNGGLTGRVVSVAPDGTANDVIVGLPSTYTSPDRSNGIYRIIPQGDSLWLIFNGNGRFTMGAYWSNSIVEVDAETLATRTVINLDEFETVNDPDGNGFDTNVGDIAWDAGGVMYIVDIAGNDLLSWTAEDGLQVVTAWADNPVPTAIEIAENGDLYIGFLGEGMADKSAKIERWSNGELVETYTGLTAVTDILLDGDVLYAVEFVGYVDDVVGTGRVVQVTSDSITPVAEGLVAPFAIAKGADGLLYVTYATVAFVPELSAGVVKIDPLLDNLQLSNTEENIVASDIERGREIYRSGINGAQRCANCHRATTRGFAVDAAPNLAGIADVAGERVEGLSAEEYLRASIVDPLAHVEGVWRTPMPEDYVDLLTEQDIEDLIVYMLQLEG